MGNWRKGIVVNTGRDQRGDPMVWASEPTGGYRGPTLTIRHDDLWLYLDGGYEECAMINIETLPEIIRQLQRLKHVLSQKDPTHD